MRKSWRSQWIIFWGCLSCLNAIGQPAEVGYDQLKAGIVAKFSHVPAGEFGTTVKGVVSGIATDRKLLAFTFDACGGPNGNQYDQALIQYLQKERIPSTLFLSGLWIDAHPDLVKQLSLDTLFEIENHGLTHKPCSIEGKSRYKIKGTVDVGQVVDEIELNAIKIEKLVHRKPVFYRSGTATTDEACAQIARALGETIVSFDVLPGDAVTGISTEVLKGNILKMSHSGGIVLMHMNRPNGSGHDALKEAIPLLRAKGYTFVKLEHQELR